jgi:hypothetical protein
VLTVTDEQRRARLGRRHRLAADSQAADVESATDSIVCLHATDAATVYLSAWARVGGLSREDVDRALYTDRTIVKQLAMRRTLFAVPRSTLPAAVSGPGKRVAAAEAARLARDVERAGLHADGARWLDAATGDVLEALSDGRQASWPELRDTVPTLGGTISYGEGKRWGGDVPVGPRVLTVLSARGEIVRASNASSWMNSRPTWASMTSWLGQQLAPIDPVQARHELVRRWLWTFGPGTERDVKWWLGDTLTNVRAALRAVGAVEVGLDGGDSGFLLPDDLDPVTPVEPWAAVLPALDATTMGWTERDWYLGPHRAELFDSNGNGGTTVWWDGRIVGGWHQRDDGNVEVHLLADIGQDGRAAVVREAERLTAWFDGDKPGARWPSPLIARLRER